MSNPFRYFNSSPEVIRLVVMMYVRYPLSLRNVEDLLPVWPDVRRRDPKEADSRACAAIRSGADGVDAPS